MKERMVSGCFVFDTKELFCSTVFNHKDDLEWLEGSALPVRYTYECLGVLCTL